MPGLKAKKIFFFDDSENISNLFGFFYCDIESPKDIYLPILPVSNKLGLECPLGSRSGWYFSEQLKFAQENGYKIKINKSYILNREIKDFKDYIDFIYNIKCNAKSNTQRLIAKSLLNNLPFRPGIACARFRVGRFGINLGKPITKIVSEDNFDELSLMNKIT